MSRATQRTLTGPDYRIEVYKDAEYGWSAMCRPTVRGMLLEYDRYCWQTIGFQDFPAALSGMRDHHRTHAVKPVQAAS
jgi:hypothetical protein